MTTALWFLGQERTAFCRSVSSRAPGSRPQTVENTGLSSRTPEVCLPPSCRLTPPFLNPRSVYFMLSVIHSSTLVSPFNFVSEKLPIFHLFHFLYSWKPLYVDKADLCGVSGWALFFFVFWSFYFFLFFSYQLHTKVFRICVSYSPVVYPSGNLGGEEMNKALFIFSNVHESSITVIVYIIFSSSHWHGKIGPANGIRKP